MAISITKPTVGGSEDTWGTTINTALDTIVDAVNGISATEPDLTEGSWKIGGTVVTATAAELNILDGVTATTAELNYVDGVTSNIQTQLDAKAPTASPTFTGTATIPTVDFGDWTITESGGSLYFATGGTNKMKLDASGNLDVVGNVNTNATIT
jgi:hypothetical protein